MAANSPPKIDRESVLRLWFERQGLTRERGAQALNRASLVDHLERTGALQLDSINVLDRAHYLTLWSRFGPYDRSEVDRWVYQERLAYEYWGHEASILPISHLPLGRRRMRRFPDGWESKAWWPHFETSLASRRRVLRRLREEGPLESAHFEARPEEKARSAPAVAVMPLYKEDKRSLKLLWHRGRIAVDRRRHFRCIYDLAERVYPEHRAASLTELEDSWLLIGLSGNGIASERHLMNYMTAPELKAAERKKVLARNLRKKRVREVRLEGLPGPFYALPEHLDRLGDLEPARGTTLLAPFDSLLFQRRRAEDLLGFSYRVEIYVPAPKRRFGYYVLPILHNGRLVGRLDPKLHRDRAVLQIKNLYLEPGVQATISLRDGLRKGLESLAEFLGAGRLELPKRLPGTWKRTLL